MADAPPAAAPEPLGQPWQVAPLQSQTPELLCVDRIRGHAELPRFALQARFGAPRPKPPEAVTLREANIDEPLSTDDVANLVGISRRQLGRLFK